jgi:anti-anti-sigma factor
VREATTKPLAIEVSSPREGVVLIALAGELEVVSVDQLSARIAALDLGGPTHVVLDLEGVTFIDSSGVNALVQAVRSVEDRGGTAVLAAPSRAAQRVFEITRLSQIVAVEEDRATALAGRASKDEPAPGTDVG